MFDFSDELVDLVASFDISSMVDIVIVGGALYWLLLLLRGTAAMSVLRGAAVLLVVAFLLARIFDLVVLNWLLRNALTGLVLAVVIIFQSDIRRALERLGRTGIWGLASNRRIEPHVLELIISSILKLARDNVGALVVLERDTGLADVIEVGIAVNARVGGELLETLFFPGTPMHDGAVVIQRGRILAAGCTLPLSSRVMASRFGTRHRAGLGLTETTDAVVLITSEERGEVSLAANGRLVSPVNERQLRVQLETLFEVDLQEAGPPEPRSIKPDLNEAL